MNWTSLLGSRSNFYHIQEQYGDHHPEAMACGTPKELQAYLDNWSIRPIVSQPDAIQMAQHYAQQSWAEYERAKTYIDPYRPMDNSIAKAIVTAARRNAGISMAIDHLHLDGQLQLQYPDIFVP